MIRDPLGVKLSVVTPVPNRLHLRVSFLLIASPCKGSSSMSGICRLNLFPTGSVRSLPSWVGP